MVAPLPLDWEVQVQDPSAPEEAQDGHVTKGVGRGVEMAGKGKVVSIGAYGAQVLCESVTESTFGLADIVETTLGTMDAVGQELEKFIYFTNTFYPNLKFTWTISGTSLPFMDLSVSISDNPLSSDIYFKPTNSCSYLDYTSSHPPFCKNVIPYPNSSAFATSAPGMKRSTPGHPR
eukprot:g31543.t1